MAEAHSEFIAVLPEDDLIKKVQKIAQSISRSTQESQKLVSAKEAALGLEISEQKFSKWRELWIADSEEFHASSQTLWGRSGWEEVGKLLDSINKMCEKIADEISRDSGLASISQPSQRTGIPMWRRFFFKVRTAQVLVPEHRDLKELVGTLSRQADELWALSERSFETRHGVFGQINELTVTSTLLSAGRTMRTASIALFRTCRRWHLDIYLGASLLGEERDADALLDMHEFGTRTLYYQLFIRPHNRPGALEELVLESLGTKKPTLADLSDIVDSSSTEWPQIDSLLRSSKARMIATNSVGEKETHYFRPTSTPRTVVLGSSTESLETLAERLDRFQSANLTGSVGRFPIAEGVELASKIAKCSFFLLGTPWLANLSSKTVRLMRTSEPKRLNDVFEIRTADMEDVMDDQPILLAVPSQLSRIGVLLIEIAFGRTTSLENQEDAELYTEPSKILPKVERLMGVQYCKATAFCLKNWGAEKHFRGGTRDAGDDRGWLTKFLEEYYVEVVRRLDDLRDSNLPVLLSPVIERKQFFP